MIAPASLRRCHVRSALAAILAAAAGALQQVGPAAADDPAFEAARRMGRGVNVLGYDGLWDGGINAPFRMSDFRSIRAQGFGHVRINLFAFRHMDAAGRLDLATLERLDGVVEAATEAGLVPVIDEHDYTECQADPGGCAPKLKAFWNQVSARYAGRFPSAVFEILNEPGGAMTAAFWNDLKAEILAEIRAGNPGRTVIVAALNTENAADVRLLQLPARDRNILLSVHYYKPFTFTHQGASWSPELASLRDVDWGSAEDKRQVEADFGVVSAWAKAERRPVYLGEFGVYERAPPAARGRYLAFIARTAERLGWAWAYWQFDHDFALFDRSRGKWVAPVLHALVPRR